MNETHYFPIGALTCDAGVDDAFRRAWYSRALEAMGEPSLSGGTIGQETYRFLWLRTWSRPVVVRFGLDTAPVRLHVIELDGAGGFDQGKVSRRDAEQLGPEDSLALLHALESADIWSMPTEDPKVGLDGAQWILEARRGDAYRAIDRWSPDAGPYRTLCELLLRKARVQFDPRGRNGLY